MRKQMLCCLAALLLSGCGKPTEDGTLAVLWYQQSGEVRGLYEQGYELGKQQLDQALAKGTGKPPAIVLDLDETVVDNSPYQAQVIREGASSFALWDEWVRKAEAKALPGALDFLRYADLKEVAIYYISNRRTSQLKDTLHNLQQLDVPQAVESHVLLRAPGEQGKDARRAAVMKTHDIVLYFGDNLSDFPGFEGKSNEERRRLAEEMKALFGRQFILFPNPMYGHWEDAMYNYEDKTEEEKKKIRDRLLQPFR
ncbi:5'-nucleotidase, lipoprotein e(P4) family [Ectobacillus ponti]|uniref:5'-nucleotidase, lipoprotein e(P4) family n=1 Tax=Ectobacillus ponti TaxID=2961894 RepID=A0AA41X2W3_9BACI|nr:5'-nucleotidase, lipoprotein e(P4) family [Ectobacillus ponti]MCP8967702.1 5'-nucleotidase, lipoprotein e(P4) family [Ectobacillus ponti]